MYELLGWHNLEAALGQIAKSELVAIDLETTGLNPHIHEILLYAFKAETGPAYLAHWGNPCMPQVRAALRSKILLAHNALFEYSFLKLRALEFYDKWFCTLLAEKILTNGFVNADRSYGAVVQKYTGRVLDKSLQTSWTSMAQANFAPTEAQYEYAAQDVLHLHDVAAAQLSFLEREGLMRVARLEFNCLPDFGDMQLNGFKLNTARHKEVLKEYVAAASVAEREALEVLDPLYQAYFAREEGKRAEEYARVSKQLEDFLAAHGVKRLSKDAEPRVRERVIELRKDRDKFKPKKQATLNLGSQQQVLAALAEGGVEPVEVDPWGNQKPSLDKNVLRDFQWSPLVRAYTAWGKPHKVVTTYGESLADMLNPVTGRIHSTYNQMVQSGRCSSSNPNQQNEPPAIRACFEAAAGNVLIVADGKNQEGRLAAALSLDPNLMGVFQRGEDWHQRTAALAYPEKFKDWTEVPKDSDERRGCKNANFSSIYGGTDYTLYQRGYVPSVAIGKILMDAVYAFAPTLREWSLGIADKAVRDGYAETISGRKRYFRLGPEPQARTGAHRLWRMARNSIRRQAMNHPVQGSGADVMKQAMIFLREPMRKLGYFIVAMVHDELVYEGPEEFAEQARVCVAEQMELAAACFVKNLPIPAEAHVTKVWEKKE